MHRQPVPCLPILVEASSRSRQRPGLGCALVSRKAGWQKAWGTHEVGVGHTTTHKQDTISCLLMDGLSPHLGWSHTAANCVLGRGDATPTLMFHLRTRNGDMIGRAAAE